MSEQTPKKLDPREIADRMRKSVYDAHGPNAVKQAEKYIKRAVIDLDRKQNG